MTRTNRGTTQGVRGGTGITQVRRPSLPPSLIVLPSSGRPSIVGTLLINVFYRPWRCRPRQTRTLCSTASSCLWALQWCNRRAVSYVTQHLMCPIARRACYARTPPTCCRLAVATSRSRSYSGCPLAAGAPDEKEDMPCSPDRGLACSRALELRLPSLTRGPDSTAISRRHVAPGGCLSPTP